MIQHIFLTRFDHIDFFYNLKRMTSHIFIGKKLVKKEKKKNTKIYCLRKLLALFWKVGDK